MSIFKFASAAIAVCFLNLLIKEYKPEYALVTQYIAELCRDAGERAIALKLEMAGKIIILAFAVPIAAAFFRALESVLP